MYLYALFVRLLARLLIWVAGDANRRTFKFNFFRKRISNVNGMFENNFIDAKVLFATKFNALANISLIKNIDTSRAYGLIMENFGNEIIAVYQYNTYSYIESQALFNMTIFVFSKKRIIVLGYDYTEILYTGDNYAWANALLSKLADFRVENRTKVIGFVKSEVLN